MILVGDVALARDDKFIFMGFENLQSKPWCLNLEGAVLNEGLALPAWGTYNTSDRLSSFSGFNLAPVFLANNHIHDLPDGVATTRQYLTEHELQCFGAGKNTADAAIPITTGEASEKITLLGFGWSVIGCKSATKNTAGVNRLEGHQVLMQATAALKKSDAGKVIVVIHGNYELEKYPQPGHRKLARQLIDAGVYAVIFHHSHIVSSIERYKGRTIAYSLGNWAFSYGQFFEGHLIFPESSFHQIAVELNDNGDKVHYAQFEPPSTVRYLKTENVSADDFSLKPEFEGFDDATYLAWFKKNRIKRLGLPIYKTAEDSLINKLCDVWVWLRQRLIEQAVVLRLKKMDRS